MVQEMSQLDFSFWSLEFDSPHVGDGTQGSDIERAVAGYGQYQALGLA
jgi:hypothetical protein